MKKIIVTILAFLYLGVSSGIAMEVHYCMGKKAGVGFYDTANDKCGSCGMKAKKGGCCNDEHKFFKLDDSHKNVSNDVCFEAPVCILTSSYPDLFEAPVYPVALRNIHNNSPPLFSKPSACILHCVFRI